MISDKLKTIFVHIPKTGGASIESIIWPPISERTEEQLWNGMIDKFHNKYQTGGLQHLHAEQIKKEIGEQRFNEYYKFSIVRNPWERTISQFFYLKKRTDLLDFIGLKKSVSLKEYLKRIQQKLHVQWEPQYKFLLNSNGDLLVDFIGRFEHLERDTECALRAIDNINFTSLYREGFQMPHLNKGNHKHYSEYYDDESKEIVADIYAEDIKEFHYCFEQKD